MQNSWPLLFCFGCLLLTTPLPVEGFPQQVQGGDDVVGDDVQWIWSEAPRQAGQAFAVRHTFTLDNKSLEEVRLGKRRWELTGAAECCRLEIWLDGQLFRIVPPYNQPFSLDVSGELSQSMPANLNPREPHRHELKLRATSVGGPSAFFLRLQSVSDSGQRRTIFCTDPSWQTKEDSPGHPITGYGRVRREPWLSHRREVGISTFDDYTQWKQALSGEQDAAPARYDLAEGFQLERLRAAGEGEDSWVSMTFDPEGRILIGMEQKGILRLTFTTPNKIGRVERVEESLLECRGLVFSGNYLYLNANNSKGFYLMRYDPVRREFDGAPVKLVDTPGNVGHGRNDLAVAPDGWISSIHGDAVQLPREFTDRTSPFREHRRGEETREGHLLRISPRGRQGEVVAAGLRNPFGVAWNADGEAFTYDADAEFDMGAPWYRPTRIIHLTSGADYGWRGVTGSWPPYYPDHPDNAPPLLDIGKGSPTAVEFGTFSDFPPPYCDSLFVLDWAYGRILAVHMQPQGAGYVARAETLLQGRPLNVTDLAFGPDGKLYFITGGRKTQSALFRVSATSARPPEARQNSPQDSPQLRARHRHARESRQLRRSLEALHQPGSSATVDHIWPMLDHPDPRIRYAARVALEHQDVADWRDRALASPLSTGTLEALLALARSPHASDRKRVFERLEQEPLERLAEQQQNVALYILQRTFDDAVEGRRELPEQLGRKLAPLYPSSTTTISPPPLNQRLSDLLARCDHPAFVPRTLKLLASEPDQATRLHYLFVLRNATRGWTRERWQNYFEHLAHAESFLGGQGMPDFLTRIREESTATAVDHSQLPRETIAQWLQSPESELPVASPPRPHVQKWKFEDFDDLATLESEGENSLSLQRGREVFHEALCSRCHRVGTEGRLLGPDLSGLGRRFAQPDILLSILEPSRVVAENYRAVQVQTDDGHVYSGRVVRGGDYRSPQLRIQTDPLRSNSLVEIPKERIEQVQETPQSWMPTGLLDSFQRDEILSLLLFLEKGGGP